MLSGELRPIVRDVLAATEALHALEEAATEGMSLVDLYAQADRVITVIREELPDDIRDRVIARIVGLADEPPIVEPRDDATWDDLLPEISPPTDI